MPRDLGLHGVLDANAVVSGPQAKPDIDLRADVRGAGARPAAELVVDAHTHAHLHGGRLKTDGWIASKDLLRFSFEGDLPAEALAQQPPNAPIRLEAKLEQADIEKVANSAKVAALQKSGLRGLVDLRISASGTLAQPRATLAVDARGIGTQTIKDVDARAGLLLDKGRVVL